MTRSAQTDGQGYAHGATKPAGLTFDDLDRVESRVSLRCFKGNHGRFLVLTSVRSPSLYAYTAWGVCTFYGPDQPSSYIVGAVRTLMRLVPGPTLPNEDVIYEAARCRWT